MSDEQFQLSYCGVSWDSEEYNKPWRDTEFLRRLYENDGGMTHEEIAQMLDVSRPTITHAMPSDASRGGRGLPYEDIAMFSGGHDSLVSTHYAMEELDCDCVLHIDTQTGIDENQVFVESVCEQFDWDLEIVTPTKTLREFALEYGFPKAPSHSWIYRYLKEHPLSSFTTELETTKPRYYTGVRRDESQRRMENVTAKTQEHDGGRWIWKAPIADWTETDVDKYIETHNLPTNPVVETIGRSGECFCGAYSDRFSELEVLQKNYPRQYNWLMTVEHDVQQEIGDTEDYCYWGSTGLSDEQLAEINHTEDTDMMMCTDCEVGGHRSLQTDD